MYVQSSAYYYQLSKQSLPKLQIKLTVIYVSMVAANPLHEHQINASTKIPFTIHKRHFCHKPPITQFPVSKLSFFFFSFRFALFVRRHLDTRKTEIAHKSRPTIHQFISNINCFGYLHRRTHTILLFLLFETELHK